MLNLHVPSRIPGRPARRAVRQSISGPAHVAIFKRWISLHWISQVFASSMSTESPLQSHRRSLEKVRLLRCLIIEVCDGYISRSKSQPMFCTLFQSHQQWSGWVGDCGGGTRVSWAVGLWCWPSFPVGRSCILLLWTGFTWRAQTWTTEVWGQSCSLKCWVRLIQAA